MGRGRAACTVVVALVALTTAVLIGVFVYGVAFFSAEYAWLVPIFLARGFTTLYLVAFSLRRGEWRFPDRSPRLLVTTRALAGPSLRGGPAENEPEGDNETTGGRTHGRCGVQTGSHARFRPSAQCRNRTGRSAWLPRVTLRGVASPRPAPTRRGSTRVARQRHIPSSRSLRMMCSAPHILLDAPFDAAALSAGRGGSADDADRRG